ncbi:protein adenylyltransferase SelO-like isoform X4 [Lepidochelys kempii]|uniref:protein adenylyltransferase SelO-like isoform X4 n=1 Tax=Lepidochelys kempii TaxID=8472 RepID=UPI003C6FFF06
MSGCHGVAQFLTWVVLICQAGCCLLDSIGAAGSFRGIPVSNKSNLDQGYCERKRKTNSLSMWSLSSESLIDMLPVDTIPENSIRKVRDCIFSVAYPTPFISRVLLVAVSKDVLEGILDLDVSVKQTDDFLQLVSGGKVVLGSIPLAHRYGGHQFGSWAGQLGDGRAHLIGVYTNSLVVSNDDVWRDQFYNGSVKKERGAVVLRVAKSWFRIGSLEILAHSGELDLQRTLLDFVIQEHFPSVNMNDSNRYLDFFSKVVLETANLIALWMSVGFAHGVCNTDNFSLLSITIDYGPFGFMESYDPNFVPNTSDDERRYKIGNQANVGMFNLNKLLQALKPVLDHRQKHLAFQILEGYSEHYYSRFTELFRAKLGLLGESEDDNYLIAFLLKLMEDTKADFTMAFQQLSEITQDQLKELHVPQEFWALQDLAKHKFFSDWVTIYLLRLGRNMGDSDSTRRKRMTAVNPRYVLRNWMAESAVQKAKMNDFSEVHLLQEVLQHPFQRQAAAEKAGYSLRPPSWAKDLKVSCSS